TAIEERGHERLNPLGALGLGNRRVARLCQPDRVVATQGDRAEQHRRGGSKRTTVAAHEAPGAVTERVGTSFEWLSRQVVIDVADETLDGAITTVRVRVHLLADQHVEFV